VDLQEVVVVSEVVEVGDHTGILAVPDLTAEEDQDLAHQKEDEEDLAPVQEVDLKTEHVETGHTLKRGDHALMVDVHSPEKSDQLRKKDAPDQRKDVQDLVLHIALKNVPPQNLAHDQVLPGGVKKEIQDLQVGHGHDHVQRIEAVM